MRSVGSSVDFVQRCNSVGVLFRSLCMRLAEASPSCHRRETRCLVGTCGARLAGEQRGMGWLGTLYCDAGLGHCIASSLIH